LKTGLRWVNGVDGSVGKNKVVGKGVGGETENLPKNRFPLFCIPVIRHERSCCTINNPECNGRPIKPLMMPNWQPEP